MTLSGDPLLFLVIKNLFFDRDMSFHGEKKIQRNHYFLLKTFFFGRDMSFHGEKKI